MAYVEKFLASFQVGDSAKKLASGTMRVSPADARTYLAAANQGARDVTDVGVLLLAGQNITRAGIGNTVAKQSIQADFVNDSFAFPAQGLAVYNSNRWKVTFSTTNNSLPATDSIYLPQYLVTDVEMESNGVNADLTEEPIVSFVNAFVATGLSKFGTAVLEVLSIERNDD